MVGLWRNIIAGGLDRMVAFSWPPVLLFKTHTTLLKCLDRTKR
jgi:hypothetical protein